MKKVFKFNIPVFILAFICGILYVLIVNPEVKSVIKYPTPYNVHKNIYRGLSDECYKFEAKEVKCTNNTLAQPII